MKGEFEASRVYILCIRYICLMCRDLSDSAYLLALPPYIVFGTVGTVETIGRYLLQASRMDGWMDEWMDGLQRCD